MAISTQIKSVWPQALTVFLLMAGVAAMSSADPTLQKSTYGDQQYSIIGIQGAINGVAVLITAPLLGAISDFTGRAVPLGIATLIFALPALLCVLSGYDMSLYFWSRSCCYIYGAIFAVISASVVDKYRAVPVAVAVAPAASSGGDAADETAAVALPSAMLQRTPSSALGDDTEDAEGQQDDVEKARTEVFAILLVAFALGFLAGASVGTLLFDHFDSKPAAPILAQLCFGLITFAWIVGVSIAWPEVWQSAHQSDATAAPSAATAAALVRPAPAANDADENNGDDEDDNNTHDQRRSGAAAAVESTRLLAVETASATASGGQTVLGTLLVIVRNRGLVVSWWITFTDFLAEQALQNLALLYLKTSLNFSATQTAILLCIIAVSAVIGNLWLIRPLRDRFGLIGLLRIAAVANLVAVVVFSVLKVAWQIYVDMLLAAVGTLLFPATTALASVYTDDDSAGAAQGFVACARFIAEAVSPAIFGYLLRTAEHDSFPGWPFLVAAGCVAVSLLLTWLLPPLPEKRRRGSAIAAAAG